MTAVRLGSVSIDCSDARGLAAFYAGLLGVEVAFASDEFCAVQLPGLWLSTQRVADYQRPTWPDPATPQQVHLDLSVADLEAGEAVALAAGATKAAVQPSPDRWRVMLDPA